MDPNLHSFDSIIVSHDGHLGTSTDPILQPDGLSQWLSRKQTIGPSGQWVNSWSATEDASLLQKNLALAAAITANTSNLSGEDTFPTPTTDSNIVNTSQWAAPIQWEAPVQRQGPCQTQGSSPWQGPS